MKNKMLVEPCIYCKRKSKIYLKSSKINNKKKINFTSTEILTEENETKPNLFYCANCEIIFSEFCKNKFEENYRDVLFIHFVAVPQKIDNIFYFEKDHPDEVWGSSNSLVKKYSKPKNFRETLNLYNAFKKIQLTE